MKPFCVSLFILLVTLLPVKVAKAIYFATDTVHLYDNGKAITDSSFIWRASYDSYYEICNKGTCNIGQQFYPVTVYRTSVSDPYSYAGYEGGSCDDACRTKIDVLTRGTTDKMILNPISSPESFKSGQVGQYRSFDYDFSSGVISNLKISDTALSYYLSIVAFFLVVILGVGYFIFRPIFRILKRKTSVK